MTASHSSPTRSADTAQAYRRQVDEAAAALRDRLEPVPTVGLVLEPGVASFDDAPAESGPWPLHALPHAPPASDGEDRRLSVRSMGDTPLLVFSGALALHEGFTPHEVVFPIRVFAEVGVETLLFANTAGSVNPAIEPGALALVTDHINFQGANPLVGPNVEDWGPRFPDMSTPYDPALRSAAEEAALRHGIGLREGVYCAVLGPNAGTQAERRMIQSLGADLVGTSTVPEVIAARHMDVRVLALSVVTERGLPGGRTSSESDDAPETSTRTQLQPLVRAIVDEEMTGTNAKA